MVHLHVDHLVGEDRLARVTFQADGRTLSQAGPRRDLSEGAAAYRIAMSGSPFKAGGNSMSYVITEPCIDVKDKACVEVCPVDCIYEGGACEPVCPVTAIFTEDEVPEPSKPFIELNRQFFVDNPGVTPCTTRN